MSKSNTPNLSRRTGGGEINASTLAGNDHPPSMVPRRCDEIGVPLQYDKPALADLSGHNRFDQFMVLSLSLAILLVAASGAAIHNNEASPRPK
jgi:hypothetical protein